MDEDTTFNILDPFSSIDLGIADSADGIKQWAIANRDLIQPIKAVFNDIVTAIDGALNAVPPLVMLALITLIAWQAAGRRTAILVGLCLFALGLLDPNAWSLAMTTLAIVISAVTACFVIGLPLGILAAKSDGFERLLRPVLGLMQTIPAFVYLVPVVMLVGIGNVSGVIVTIVFALPPLIRLTSLGIRGVNPSVVEAAQAFGASPRQILVKVELPLAAPTILAGVNQTIMLALSMVVVAGLAGADGLGTTVVSAVTQLDIATGVEGGLAVVIVAIFLDRFTSALAERPEGSLLARLRARRPQKAAARAARRRPHAMHFRDP